MMCAPPAPNACSASTRARSQVPSTWCAGCGGSRVAGRAAVNLCDRELTHKESGRAEEGAHPVLALPACCEAWAG